MFNQKYNTGPGKGVEDIVFRNISCTGKYINPSVIQGYDKDRKVTNILFENIVLNGKRVTSLEELNVNKKDFVDKVRIKVSVSAILSCRPFFILIFLRCIKMKHYGFSRKSIWKNLETFP